MVKLDERMELIRAAILDQAERESKEIIRDINAYRERELKKFREETTDSMYDTLQRDVISAKLKAQASVAKFERDSHRALLSRREELTSSVFDGARERLNKYADSEDYKEKLLAAVQTLSSRYACWDHSKSVFYLRKEDLLLSEKISALLPGVRIEQDASIRLGGFILANTDAKTLVDETLDTALTEQKLWFLQYCGMKVV